MLDIAKCFVFSDLGGHTRLVGRFTCEPGSFGEFQYADSFLNSGSAFPLDPINLGLQRAPFFLRSIPYVFGVLLDAGPDDWGRKVLHAIGKRVDGIEPLIRASGTGVGSLLFSGSPSTVKPRPVIPSLANINDLLTAAADVESGTPLPAHLAELLEPGSDMGGARPKAVVTHEGVNWLAKFPARDDVLDQPACEYATLALARKLAISVPDHHIERVGNRSVLLVKRFDIDPATGGRLHYLSMAAALVVGRRLSERDNMGAHSYMGLAALLNTHGRRGGDDAKQLFRRMAFNALMGHVDDHSRNHGMLLRAAGQPWELAPAFDMAPSNGTAASISKPLLNQAIGIGAEGSKRSMTNLLSRPADFGLEPVAAMQIVDEVRSGISEWKLHFKKSGVSDADINKLSHRVDALE